MKASPGKIGHVLLHCGYIGVATKQNHHGCDQALTIFSLTGSVSSQSGAVSITAGEYSGSLPPAMASAAVAYLPPCTRAKLC